MTVGYGNDVHAIVGYRVDQLVRESPEEDLSNPGTNLFANFGKSLDN
jgi:hypothetical protein